MIIDKEAEHGSAGFWYWINERHQITLNRRAAKPWPWTADPILQQYRFTNVFRELDTVTVWIRTNWREAFPDHPNLMLAMALARQVNWPDTLAAIGFPQQWQPTRIKRVMRTRMDAGQKTWTGAYMVHPDHQRPMPKEIFVVDEVLQPLHDKRREWEALVDGYPPRQLPLQVAWDWLTAQYSWGGTGFMAYEVITDLRHTRYCCRAPDIKTWANPGPGARRGLNRIWGRQVKAPLHRDVAIHQMRQLLAIANSDVTPVGMHVPGPLEMRDIEHCLCEFDKYERVRLGEGKPRARYGDPTR